MAQSLPLCKSSACTDDSYEMEILAAHLRKPSRWVLQYEPGAKSFHRGLPPFLGADKKQKKGTILRSVVYSVAKEYLYISPIKTQLYYLMRTHMNQ